MAALLDTTIVNMAVATLGHEFHATVTTTQWAITGYLLAIAIVIPAADGRWTASARVVSGCFRWPRPQAVRCCAALAWSVSALIAFRVL